MMKVEPKFHLDHTFKGPYCVLDVEVNDPSAEKLNVSLQRLLKFDSQLSEAVPWIGHGGIKRRRQIRKLNNRSTGENLLMSQLRTKRGQVIRTPAQFNQVASPVYQPKRREVVESRRLNSTVSVT